MSCGAGVAIEVMALLRKLRVVCNSFSNSLLLCFYSKIIVSSVISGCKAGGST